jgi:AraC-like DNA-binding protein
MTMIARISGEFAPSDMLREAAYQSIDIVVARNAFSRVDSPIMAGVVTTAQVQPGLQMSGHDVTYLEDGVFEADIGRSMTCGILLDGSAEPMEVPGYAPVDHAINRLTIIGFGETLPCRRPYRKHQRSRAFGLTITPEFFERFEASVSADDLAGLRRLIDPGFHVRHLHGSTPLIALTSEALDHPYSGPLSELFQESLALRFVVEAARLLDEQAQLVADLGRKGYDRVMEARDILDAALIAPPKTLDLARRVGTNVSSLQAGFRKAFGTTLFGYVRDQRLTMARILMIDHGLGVAEAGYKVGFTNASAFTAAYRRRFGHPPTAER